MAARQTPSGSRTITLADMDEYPKGMFGFRLPPGYRLQAGPDVLVLRRADGLMVAAFVAPGVDRAEVEREAAKDFWRSGRPSGLPAAGLPGFSSRPPRRHPRSTLRP
jgi:hypothetical protein